MSILPLQTEELHGPKNKILRAHSHAVVNFRDPKLHALIRDMRDTLATTKNGVGLAAPQVGTNIRVFVASPKLELAQLVYINPVITKLSQERKKMEEGCLSVPRKYGMTRRAPVLKMEAYNEEGKKFKVKAEGLIAQLIQHEIGHLDGKLFSDSAKNIFNAEDISDDES